MTEYQFFYRRDSLQIDAVYRDCKTHSAKFKDVATYVEVNVTDPPFEVTRDHKVVLDAGGNVVGTEPSPNPIQPEATPPVVPERMDLRSPDGTIWTISVDNQGRIKTGKK